MSTLRPRAALTSTLLAAALVTGVLCGSPAQAITGDAANDGAFAFTARLDIGNGARACSGYLRGTTNTSINQGKDGVVGTMEKGDRFGTSVAASPEHLAVGTPHEAIGEKTDAGAVQILAHKVTGGFPTPLVDADQNDSALTISGSAETGDQFAHALSMTSHRTVAGNSTAATESVLAIGVPGEALETDIKEGGRVVTVKITAAGKAAQLDDLSQAPADIIGTPEAGDRFGQQVAAVSTAPGAVATTSNALLAVGVPGEDVGTATNSGSLIAFSLLGNAGDREQAVEPGTFGLPGTPGANQKVGTNLHATGAHLYLGMPNGPTTYGAVHTVPWANITSGATDAVTTYEPGKGGLPAAGVNFGAVIR
ncbi:hypothetical protein ACFQVC_26840 [Streptomyces monticola]|uniref:Uncharacterized protein n=1 Tax=Streptomyces monticola TaxID=2666263 RepID=A0ABW2JQB1_9ACTN